MAAALSRPSIAAVVNQDDGKVILAARGASAPRAVAI
jgi:hypothetical protein